MSSAGGALARVAPRTAATWRLFRRLDSSAARGVFVRRELGRRVFRRLERLPPVGPDGLILFVCHGNIMRSALAEAALRQALDSGGGGPRVASAGTAARTGDPADPRTIAYASRIGLDLRGHRARRLDASLAGGSDLIFALDRRIEAEVVAKGPALAERTILLAGIAGTGPYAGRDVEDPYLLAADQTAPAFDLVMASVRALAGRLLRPNRPTP